MRSFFYLLLSFLIFSAARVTSGAIPSCPTWTNFWCSYAYVAWCGKNVLGGKASIFTLLEDASASYRNSIASAVASFLPMKFLKPSDIT